MRCQSCGKEIADKAIICYRCGAPTAMPAPKARPAAPGPGVGDRGPLLGLVLLVVLLAGAGLLYWQDAPPWSYAALGGAVAAAFVGLRLGRRRGPRA